MSIAMADSVELWFKEFLYFKECQMLPKAHMLSASEDYDHTSVFNYCTSLYCATFPTFWHFLKTSFTASSRSLIAVAISLGKK